MISTLYGTNSLDAPLAFFLALAVGSVFGFFLERAGFGSSRRLSAVFYLRDMTVVKVMFTAVLTALLGLDVCLGLGWLQPDQLYFMPTVYGAHVGGGLIFGVGFAIGGWCPGTAATGVATGKLDALVFLVGACLGSVLFNELFAVVKPLYTAGDRGVQFLYANLGLSRGVLAFLVALVAIAAFWVCEKIETLRSSPSPRVGKPFLRTFSLVVVFVAGGLLLLPQRTGNGQPPTVASTGDSGTQEDRESAILAAVAEAEDHLEPEELADRIMADEPQLLVVDVRPPEEFAAFHLPGARNIALPDLPQALAPYRNQGLIVLYSNGMTHPAQGRDALARLGYRNVRILTDGLDGFRRQCLKPVSLRPAPLAADAETRVRAWRSFFLAPREPAPTPQAAAEQDAGELPALVDPAWLSRNLSRPGLRIVDLRPQPEYNGGHIEGAVCLSIESFRGVVAGRSSMLLPPDVLARHFGLLGLRPNSIVVFSPADKMQDATLCAMACERLGHENYAILDGGHARWQAEGMPVVASLPSFQATTYPVRHDADAFTVDSRAVLDRIGRKGIVILDVRPADYFAGRKSDEPRAGHIPSALNRPYTEDVVKAGNGIRFKATDELGESYAALIPDRGTEIILHCRTGHQASQTFFVLRHLLGYNNVLWYGAGWSEWSALPELPVER